jgi:dolichyl-phosphate-mannose-protein mannosyltransferase
MSASRGRFARLLVSVALPLIALSLGSIASGAEKNLFLNADLSKGAGNSPDHWRTEGWDSKPSVTNYKWVAPAGGAAGQLVVDNSEPNDARWMQSLSLGPGWYYISAEIRTEDVPANQTGASISILEDGITSLDLKGTTPWSKQGFYLKVGRYGADIEVALRLGGYGSLNKGRAFFRNPSLVPVSAPPQGAERVFDLAQIRKASETPPVGKAWTLVAVFILLGIVAVVGWRLFGEATLHPVAVVEEEKPKESSKAARPAARGQRRRRN